MGAIDLDDRLIRKPDVEEVAVAGRFLDGHAETYVRDAGYGAQHALTVLGHREHLLAWRLGVEEDHVPDHACPQPSRIRSHCMLPTQLGCTIPRLAGPVNTARLCALRGHLVRRRRA